jgi:hypothetical protein
MDQPPVLFFFFVCWMHLLDPVPLSSSGFKTSDQVQGQSVRPIEKAQSARMCGG